MRPILLPLLAIAACAAPPPPPAPPPLPPLAQVAMEEWQAWGRPVILGWPDDRPADTAATPARFERLLGYWEGLPGHGGIARRLRAQRAAVTAGMPLPPPAAEDVALAAAEGAPSPDPGPAPADLAPGQAPTDRWAEDMSLYARPFWSAAFIGALARRAGIPEADLPSAPTHARYIDAMLMRAMTQPEDARFVPLAPEERAPRPGDLLCADRTARPLTHWTDRLAERGRFRPMHCDVVVGAAPGAVEMVGGNVADLVAMRRVPGDAEGRVLPPPEGRPPFVLLLAARSGPPVPAEEAWSPPAIALAPPAPVAESATLRNRPAARPARGGAARVAAARPRGGPMRVVKPAAPTRPVAAGRPAPAKPAAPAPRRGRPR